jgi:hypothetical protein
MFAKSAASDTLQGKAIQAVNEKWGADVLCRSGRETIGIPVCKKKYKPFHFNVAKKKDGLYEVQVERLYACRCHHKQRKAVIEQHGVREGWQPFGVWSMKKAQEEARRETARLNANTPSEGETTEPDESSSDSSIAETAILSSSTSMCLNGDCTWKVASSYDNIYREIHGHSESEAEDR